MEASALDYVAQACMDLNDALSVDDSDRDTLLANHIKKLSNTVAPIEDFKKNLDWVNVSEAISLSQHCTDKVVVLDFWTYCCINCYHVLPDLASLEKLYPVETGLVVVCIKTLKASLFSLLTNMTKILLVHTTFLVFAEMDLFSTSDPPRPHTVAMIFRSAGDIGVHSAKFLNERDSSNVLAAVQRYNIHHPVVNDAESGMWEALGIKCWPTLLILGPGNKPIFVITGEGHRAELELYVGALLKYHMNGVDTASLPISAAKVLQAKKESVLRFPSKLTTNPYYRGRFDEPFLAISDTGNHRVLLTDCSGIVVKVIGGPDPGFKDGKLNEAKFNCPQGLCWLSSNVITVCDTNNHAVRAVHLDEGTVEVLAGTGNQAEHGDLGGKCLGLQPLASPWDILLYTTPDMDMSVRTLLPPPPPPPGHTASDKDKENVDRSNEKEKKEKDEKRRVLLIACAGSHQIWALFLDTTIWWKYKTFTEGTCVCIAGSGAEAARNSSYPNTAAFAQPSGLTVRMGTSPEMFIADSESSSIRKLALSSGQVSTLCGGDKNPLNLFAFGDSDDIGTEAKLQHPLAVVYSDTNKTLYIADTYNNKIKKVDISTQKVTTMNIVLIESTDLVKFNEPSGLSLSSDGKYLYVADTNNHSIKIINTSKNTSQEFNVRLPEQKFVEPDNLIMYPNDLFVNKKCGNLIIYFDVNLDSKTKNMNFTPGAPQNWNVSVRDDESKDVTDDDFDFINCSRKGSKLPGRVEMKLKTRAAHVTHYRMYLSFNTALCNATVCFSHQFTIKSSILVRESVKMVESYKITCKVNPANPHPELNKS